LVYPIRWFLNLLDALDAFALLRGRVGNIACRSFGPGGWWPGLDSFGQARAERIHQINDLAGSGHFQLFGRHNLLAGNLLVDSAENALLFLVFVLRRIVVFVGNLVNEL
jgi:hypothetical protein